jgi:nitroreductase
MVMMIVKRHYLLKVTGTLLLLLLVPETPEALLPSTSPLFQLPALTSKTTKDLGGKATSVLNSQPSDDSSHEIIRNTKAAFDSIVLSRFACKKFHRHDNNSTARNLGEPTPSNKAIVQQALHCLELARRAPSGFNTQPYKVVLVHSEVQKRALSRFGLGPNKKRILDSDCTAVFLADREVMRTFPRYLRFLREANPEREPSRKIKAKILFYISLFSQGFPLPRFLAAPISFLFRMVVSVFEFLLQKVYVLPSFSSAETWTTKQIMLFAMTYILGCTSRGLATIPMEGINAAGMRSVLKIPRRYSIPLVVATGLPYQEHASKAKSLTVSQNLPENASPRYPMDEMIFDNQFGETLGLAPQS